MAAFTWRGVAAAQDVVNAGPLALIEPLLDQLDIEAIIDRHLPPDPQLEYSHGQVLRVLLAARPRLRSLVRRAMARLPSHLRRQG